MVTYDNCLTGHSVVDLTNGDFVVVVAVGAERRNVAAAIAFVDAVVVDCFENSYLSNTF